MSVTSDAHQIHLASTVVSTGIAAAWHNLDVARAGWPTTTPGAAPAEATAPAPCLDEQCTHIRPCPIHDDAPIHLTATESAALGYDKAAHDMDVIERKLGHARTLLNQVAGMVTFWAHQGMNAEQVRTRLTAIDALIWCENCVRWGRHEPRAKDRTECDFCAAFRRDYKQPAPREIWDARDARGGRIDVTTIQRILKQVREARQEAEAAEKAARKRAKQAERASAG